ncbi:MAG: glycosyltransferase [Deltaproteobacteria bacterium]|nr:glycosyltransferase [Deltaproteobacteria bacterium]
MRVPKKIIRVEDFERYTGPETVERIIRKAKQFQDMHVVHVNSTYYGGGVAEVLSSKTLLMNSLGIKTGWRVIQGSPDFFSITKKMHNALQGDRIGLTERKMQIYEDVIYENVVRNHLDHDIVIVHDPQPLAMIRHHRKFGPWIWRCHIDLTKPNPEVMRFLLPYINMYDAVILTLKEYKQKFKTPQLFFFPTINPFSITNQDLSEEEISERLGHYRIPVDLPLVVQVSRFDRWKDPGGVIEAFRIARKKVDCTLVLLGNVATDDPEGEKVYQSLMDNREERIIILSVQDSALVNALQRRATVVLQKSLREGFGLTVAEAMWKRTPVIGGNVGGIRHQIEDGKNGFLVSSVTHAAERIVQLVKDKKLNRTMGKRARETVRKNYLLTRSVERYLDMFGSFETSYKFVKN